MAKKSVGYVNSMGLNPHKVTVFIQLGEQPEKRFVLFNDPNAAIIPQAELAGRSFMVSALQSALAHHLPVILSHAEGDDEIQSLRVLEDLEFDFDFDFDADTGSPKRKAPIGPRVRDTAKKPRRPQPA